MFVWAAQRRRDAWAATMAAAKRVPITRSLEEAALMSARGAISAAGWSLREAAAAMESGTQTMPREVMEEVCWVRTEAVLPDFKVDIYPQLCCLVPINQYNVTVYTRRCSGITTSALHGISRYSIA